MPPMKEEGANRLLVIGLAHVSSALLTRNQNFFAKLNFSVAVPLILASKLNFKPYSHA